ncbi:DNA-binding protein [Thiorhodococcus minor]|uniref:DNA-binding protein n=2 Tax=Thiorhodococcus minor TaxID=57489 RepID=A0A6M0K7E1_9GAMM|nr:DNA-binding protein [Thiorhodococcus minor]
MRTVIETPTFQRLADAIWSEEERLAFIAWLSQNPLTGDVIPGAEGARKVRWAGSGRGKRGGVRVIYFNLSAEGVLYLITIYRKSEQANIKADSIKRAIE